MTRVQILQEIEKLTPAERIRLIGAALKTLDKKPRIRSANHNAKMLQRRLRAAAKVLKNDYQPDGELTSFTALDAERFHA